MSLIIRILKAKKKNNINYKYQGFTFIEIMVILAIMTIIVTVVGISKIKAGPFSYYLKQAFGLIEQRAILEQNNFGVCIYKKGILIYRYNQTNSSWQEISNNIESKNVTFPDTLKINLMINEQQTKLPINCIEPNLIFNTGGFITPFQLLIQDKSTIFTVTGNYGGGISVAQKTESKI